MIEKVARAIESAHNNNVGQKYSDLLNSMAQAAIQAMREPSEKMIAAAQSLIKDTPGVAGEDICPDPEFAYETMIDAALKE